MVNNPPLHTKSVQFGPEAVADAPIGIGSRQAG